MSMLVAPRPAADVPSDADIAAAVGGNAFHAGAAYAAAGRVSGLILGTDGQSLESNTQGGMRRPYHQSVKFRPTQAGGFVVNGFCTCPMRINCKHVAAALLAARGRGMLGAGEMPLAPAAVPVASAPTAVPAGTAPMGSGSSGGAPRPIAEETLPPAIAAWLDSLPRAQEDDSEDYPATVPQRMFYVIDTARDHRDATILTIAAQTVALRKDGSLGETARNAALPSTTGASLPRYARPSDRIPLLRLGARLRHTRTIEDDPEDTLRRILATGRARFGAAHGNALREGPPRPGKLVWTQRADGTQLPGIVPDRGIGVPLPAPWYLDAESGEMGPVALDLPAALATRLLEAPPLDPFQVDRVGAELRRRLPGLAVPPPLAPPPVETLRGPPVPVLTLGLRPAIGTPGGWGHVPAGPDSRLSFRYGPIEEPAGAYALTDRGVLHDGTVYRVVRDRASEQAAGQHLLARGFQPMHALPYRPDSESPLATRSLRYAPIDPHPNAWLRLMIHDVPTLRAAGWEVIVTADFPLRVVETDTPLAAELRPGRRGAGEAGSGNAAADEGSGIDWLDLHLGATIAGERVDLVPALLQMLATIKGDLRDGIASAPEESSFVLPLLDGRILSLRLGQIRPVLLALIEIFAAGAIDPADKALRFTRHNAAELAALEDAVPEVVWRGGEAIRGLGRQLREAGGSIPVATLPTGFHGTLRPYQARGVDWLQFLRHAGLGGVLADDMGLGKTVQTLAHLLIEKAAGRLDRPALIVCPTSLVPNWCAEAARFAPGLRLLALHGPARRQHFAAIGGQDVVITTYPLLNRDAAVLAGQEWHVLVLDEAQSIKNPLAEVKRVVSGLAARQRLCLSGTPLQNHLGELWSLFDFLAPGFLGSARHFRARFRVPVEKHGDEAARERLARRVRPFLLRRTKEEVAADLPPKTEIVEAVAMEAGQRALYESIRLAMHARVREAIAARGMARSGIVILDALLKLRQACCDPRLLKLKAAQKAGSAKLERLLEMLPDLIEDGRRVLLFSQFTSMLDLIIPRLEAARLPFVMLTGDTLDRASPVRRFQAGEVPLFLLSLKAGGTGLNLTAADTVIHYDPWWNPAVEDQATDRAHRIGQSKPVFVHRMVTQDSIEEKMEGLKSRKRALVDGILKAEQGGALRLTEADIEALFGA